MRVSKFTGKAFGLNKPLGLKRTLQIRFVLLSLAALVALQTMIVGFSAAGSWQRMTLNADRLIMQADAAADSRQTRSARTFRVTVDPSTGEVTTERSRMAPSAPTPSDEIVQYARQIASQETDKGYAGEYRYLARRSDDAVTITFLSRQEALEAFRTNTGTMILMSVVGVATMTALLAIVSGAVVAPLVNNRRRQQEFITSASHELKTPLTVISADAQLLESEIGSNEWLTDIVKQTDEMADMTRRLVFLARAEEQGGQFTRIDFPISDLAQDVAEPYRAIAMNQGKGYATDIQPGLSYRGDEKAIRELMSALIDNAFKYSPAGGGISVNLVREGRGVRFTVSNTATGVDPSQMERFSQRFYRANASPDIAGFGIGLSLAQAVAQAHRGTLTITMPQEHVIAISATLGGTGSETRP